MFKIIFSGLVLLLFTSAGYSQSNTKDLNLSLIQSIDSSYQTAQENIYKDLEFAAKKYRETIQLIDSLPRNTKDLRSYLKKQANAYRVLGSYAAMNHELVEALELQEKSLDIKRRIGERESQIQNYKAMSALWGDEGDMEKAGMTADSAYNIAIETNSKKYLSEAARGKATFFRASQMPDSAEYYFQIAVKTADDAPGKVPKYAALDMYGRFLREEGRMNESLTYVDQFLEALEVNYDTVFFPAVFLTKGETQLALNNPYDAIESYKQGLFYAQKT
ncbi:MAG: hypothetical protein AAGH46_08230, partial [Bacteroidota bacterium]